MLKAEGLVRASHNKTMQCSKQNNENSKDKGETGSGKPAVSVRQQLYCINMYLWSLFSLLSNDCAVGELLKLLPLTFLCIFSPIMLSPVLSGKSHPG